jgi:beta-lactamase class A
MSFTRRNILATAALLPFAGALAADTPEAVIAAIERQSGGRLGVSALDTESGQRILHRADERFAMCSTFKLLLIGAELHRAEKGEEQLDRRIAYTKADIMHHSPVAEAHLTVGSLTVGRMAEAVIRDSDNTFATLLLNAIGGPSAVTRYARSLGDRVTRLDRTEPVLNSAIKGDPRDTTSPRAMMEDMRLLVLGDALSDASRKALTEWLIGCNTAAGRIPAGLPAGWKSGNKTGTGDNGTTNDVAIIWPPDRKPILLSVYFTESKLDDAGCEKVIADVARVVSGAFA